MSEPIHPLSARMTDPHDPAYNDFQPVRYDDSEEASWVITLDHPANDPHNLADAILRAQAGMGQHSTEPTNV